MEDYPEKGHSVKWGKGNTLTAQRQVLVIGLDGATYDIIDPLLDAGELPTLARIIREGARGTLQSTIPPNSAPAWTSFLTGVNPGKHGILDFREVDLRQYTLYTGRFVNSTTFAGHTILDLIGQHTRGVVSFRVPMTYPVWPVNGILVAGYPTPDRKKAYTYPPELSDALTPIALHSHEEIARATPDDERANADYEIEVLLKHMGAWLRENRYDFYVAVTGITDGFHHKFWKYHDPTHPLHDPRWPDELKNIIREYYRRLDRMVGDLLNLVDERWLVVVMSDHGGGPRPHRLFNTNAWLAQQGWLSVRQGGSTRTLYQWTRHGVEWLRSRLPRRNWLYDHLPQALRRKAVEVRQGQGLIDWTRTQAYRVPLQFPAEGIEVNLRGRQPKGIVTPEEYESLRTSIIAALREARDPATGLPVVRGIWRREEVYRGPYLDHMPDIVFLTADHLACGTDLEDVFTELPLSFLERLSGDHTMTGIALFWGEGVQAGSRFDLNIVDLPPTLVWTMGLEVPEDMDGRVLTEAFTADYVRAHPVSFGPPYWQQGLGDEEVLTEEEEAEIRKALAGLGYVEE